MTLVGYFLPSSTDYQMDKQQDLRGTTL
jgi:hypothetical protein